MPTQSQALQLMLETFSAIRAAGYTQEDVQELVTAAFEHLDGDPSQPYACGHCTNCRRLIIGWSVYHWSILVSEPCPGAESPGQDLTSVDSPVSYTDTFSHSELRALLPDAERSATVLKIFQIAP